MRWQALTKQKYPRLISLALKSQLKYQWTLWLVALSFFTRIKVASFDNFEQRWLNQASRYYGLVGLLIGGLSAIIFVSIAQVLPLSIAIILAMIASIIITGGFHEDGLADTWDGFGGGWSIEKKLAIMKDSRLGTYGSLALIVTLLLKFQLLVEIANIDSLLLVIALLVAHCLSRVMAVSIIFDQPYVRDTDSSKIKPMTEQQSSTELVILLLSGVIPLLLLPWSLASMIVLGLVIIRFGLNTWYRRQIGGYTGDLLGGAQQMAELGCYIILLAYWR